MSQDPDSNTAPSENQNSSKDALNEQEPQKATNTQASKGPDKAKGGIASSIVKTILDTEALRAVAAKLKARSNDRLKEEIDEREPAPFKEYIRDYKTAAPCGLKAEQNMKEGDRVGFCEQCKQQVYDFNKMELAEAKLLILQREGKKEPQFFKRSDGRFMSSDCPVGKKLRLNRTILLIAAGMVTLLGLLALCSALQTSKAPALKADDTEQNKVETLTPAQLPLAQKPAQTTKAEDSVVFHYKSSNPIDPSTLPMGSNFQQPSTKWEADPNAKPVIDPAKLPMSSKSQ